MNEICLVMKPYIYLNVSSITHSDPNKRIPVSVTPLEPEREVNSDA